MTLPLAQPALDDSLSLTFGLTQLKDDAYDAIESACADVSKYERSLYKYA